MGVYIKNLAQPKEEYANRAEECQGLAIQSFEKVQRLISYLRDYAGAQNIDRKAGDFVEIIQRTIAELNPESQKQGVGLHYEGPAHLIGLFDASKVSRVLTNLCVNALQAMDKSDGSITISLLHNAHAVWMDVIDSGKGIEEEHLPKLFQKKFTFGKKDGTGLGLAFCRKIMEAHGGSIGVTSKMGNGATFSIVFPRARVALAEEVVNPTGHTVALQAYVLDEEEDTWGPWVEQWQQKYGEENVALFDAAASLPRRSQDEITLDPMLH